MTTDVVTFSEHLQEFKAQYTRQSALIKQHIDDVLTFLGDELNEAGVRFQSPISSRMKTLDSAIRSLERRASARMERSRLKDSLERQGWDWQDYWQEYGRDDRINDYGPYESCSAMFRALHDIGGIRILVYFPGDIELAVKCLEGISKIKVVRKLFRSQKASSDIMDLRRDVRILERKVDKEVKSGENTFTGYRATHIHVCMANDPEVIIEIQIATVVMNAWSQVEHDIIYKPRKAVPTRDETRILDTLNGVVMVGENALRQLEETIKRQEICHANEESQFATSIYDLGQWIINHCHSKGIFPLKETTDRLNGLEYLLEVLMVVEEHTFKTVKLLIDGLLSVAGNDSSVFSHQLPLHMLTQLHRISKKISNNPTFPDPSQTSWLLAKLLASRVVQTLNIAVHMGIECEFVNAIGNSLRTQEGIPRPSFVDFLDALHPEHPRMHWASYDPIYKFCHAFLDLPRLRTVISDNQSPLIEAPLILVEMGLVVQPKEIDDQERAQNQKAFVPRSLYELLSDSVGVPGPFTMAGALCFHHQEHQHVLRLMSISLSSFKEALESCVSVLESSRFQWQFENGQSRTYRRIASTDTTAESQAEDFGQSPKMYPGYFESISEDDLAEPRWKYVENMPRKWKLSRFNVENESTGSSIEKFERKDELLDLASSLIESGNLRSSRDLHGRSLYHTLTIEGKEFTILSENDKFILYQGKWILSDSLASVHVSGARTQDEEFVDDTQEEQPD